MDSQKSAVFFSIAILSMILIAPYYVVNLSSESEEGKDYLTEKNPSEYVHVLFDSIHPASAVLRRASNYHFLSNVTDVVKYDDGWIVGYNKKVVLDVKWNTYIHDGDKILFKARLIGTCPQRKILITAPHDPSTVYGYHEFHDSSEVYFNVTLNLPDEINEFDVVIHYSCRVNRYFLVDYISLQKISQIPYWHDASGAVITKYKVSFEYQVNISNLVDPSSVYLEVSVNSSIVTPNGTIWIPNHGTFYEVFSTEPYVRLLWESRWLRLPPYSPPFCMWSATEYGDDGSDCSSRSQMNITVSAHVTAYGKLMNGSNWVSDVKIVENIRNYPIYWY